MVAVRPSGRRCGLALYRPIDLDKLAESNYLELRFSRELHWTALLTAVDLIKQHARMLWRLVESQLTAAPLEARYQLMRRLAGDRALTGRHAEQLRALSAPDALFLTIDPAMTGASDDGAPPEAGPRGGRPARSRRSDCLLLRQAVVARPIGDGRRAAQPDHARPPGARARRDRHDRRRRGCAAGADPATAGALRKPARRRHSLRHQRSARRGRAAEDRAVHLVLQMPRELMRYPWELLRDRHGWLVERFAIGRQVIADAERAPRWRSNPRQGPLRLLVVAPSVPRRRRGAAGAGALEGVPRGGLLRDGCSTVCRAIIDPSDYMTHVDRPVTVEEFRDAAPVAPLRHRALRRPRPLRRRQPRSELLDVCRRPALRIRAAGRHSPMRRCGRG